MNFRSNSFSLGAGQYVSSEFRGGQCHIYVKKDSVTSRRIFDPAMRSLVTAERAASYADMCWPVEGGLIELRGGTVSYERR